MACKGLKPKVEQLEQVKIAFDDANSVESQGPMPFTVNSKNKSRIIEQQPKVYTRKRVRNSNGRRGAGPFLGFKEPEESGEEEENKDNNWSRKDQHAKTIFRPAQQSDNQNDSDHGYKDSFKTIVNG